jgi:hypothetical protein
VADQAAEVAASVLRQAVLLLAEITADEIGDLAAGRKRFSIVDVPPGDSPPPIPRDSPRRTVVGARRGSQGRSALNPEEVRPVIMAMSSREEAADYIGALGTVAMLRSLADSFGVGLTSKDKKADVVRKIVDGTVGLELTAQAMRGTTS